TDPGVYVYCVRDCLPPETNTPAPTRIPSSTRTPSPTNKTQSKSDSNHAFNIPSIYSLLVYSVAMCVMADFWM
ncbi:9466_t:CDS:1, partial [Ambispora gerdemannii]